MDNLYIQVDDSENCINHPAFESNLIQVYGCIPKDWEPFIRVAKPEIGIYKIIDPDTPIYKKIDGVWIDVWNVRDMTSSERLMQQEIVHKAWKSHINYWNHSAWVFNEDKCEYEPPFPKPSDGQKYFWQGSTNSWQVIPPKPEDDKNYILNFNTGQWQVTPPRPEDEDLYVFDKQAWIWVKQNV